MILDIKHYIFNLVPSKLVLPESVVASITIHHQMVMIHVQVGINFIEDVFLDGDFGVNIIMEIESAIRSIKTKTNIVQLTYG